MGCTDGYIRYTQSFTKTESITESFSNYVKTEYGTLEHSSRTNIVKGTLSDTLYYQTSFDEETHATFLTNGNFNGEYYSSETATSDLSQTFSSVAGPATTDTQQCFEEAGDGASATQTITATNSNYYSNKTQTASSTVPFCIDGTNTSSQSYEYTQQVYDTDSVIDGETYTAESYEGQAPPGGEFRTVTISEGYYNVNLTGDTWDGIPDGVYTKTEVNSTGSDIGYTTTFLTVDPTIAGATTITASASITRFTSQTFGPPTGNIFTDGNTTTDSQGTTILYAGQNNEVTRVTFWPFDTDDDITSSNSIGAQVVFKATQSDDPFVGRTQQSQYFWPNTGAVGITFGETNKYAVQSTFTLNDTARSTRERFNLLSQDAPGWNVWAVTPVFPDAFFGFGNSANAKTRDLYTTIITNTSGSSLSQINTASITTALKTGAIGRGGGSIFVTGSCGFLVENDSSRTLAWDTTNPDFNTSSKLLATHATTYESVVNGTSQTLTSSETMAFLISCSGKLDSKNDYATIDESMQGPVYGISYLGKRTTKMIWTEREQCISTQGNIQLANQKTDRRWQERHSQTRDGIIQPSCPMVKIGQ